MKTILVTTGKKNEATIFDLKTGEIISSVEFDIEDIDGLVDYTDTEGYSRSVNMPTGVEYRAFARKLVSGTKLTGVNYFAYPLFEPSTLKDEHRSEYKELMKSSNAFYTEGNIEPYIDTLSKFYNILFR